MTLISNVQNNSYVIINRKLIHGSECGKKHRIHSYLYRSFLGIR